MAFPMRRTRFVCVSDTHNMSGAFKLPKGDVLIHAGDLTNQGSFSELQKAVKWLEEAEFESKIVIAGMSNSYITLLQANNTAGNHDITLDTDFYAQYSSYFHNQNPQDPSACQQLMQNSPSILYLKHEAGVVNLTSPTGPHTTFKIFGSPFSPANGMWAFGYHPDEAQRMWDTIPLDSDIVLTHTPPKYHCDERKDRRAAGCEALRMALWRIRPRLAICGHIHESRGAERVLWDLDMSNIKFKESSVARWMDPGVGNRKLSLVDLTIRGGNPLQNDGSVGDWNGEGDALDIRMSRDPAPILQDGEQQAQPKSRKSSRSPRRVSLVERGISQVTHGLLAVPPEALPLATLGQGGVPPSKRCDLEALSGRMGRRETCVVNAAVLAASWPHSAAGGGGRFNKPVVVDLDLPVWE